MTPEQIARFSLEIGREVTELVQRRLAETAQWGPTPSPSTPIHEDEQPVGTFARMMYGTNPAEDPDGGVAEDARRVVRGQPPLQPRPEDEDGA